MLIFYSKDLVKFTKLIVILSKIEVLKTNLPFLKLKLQIIYALLFYEILVSAYTQNTNEDMPHNQNQS